MKPRKQNDTYSISFVCGYNGIGTSLATAASVHFRAFDSTGTLQIDSACTPNADQDRNPGLAVYSPVAGDVDTAGRFKVEVLVTWNNGIKSKFPSDGFESLTIIPTV
jgi:hypothetical protein